jgi:hypothetical protein
MIDLTSMADFLAPDGSLREIYFVPKEIDTPERLQALLEFVETLGQSTGKTVVVTLENHPEWAFLRYDPHRAAMEQVHT